MTADLTPAQAARFEAIEAAPYAEEAAVERVARALWETDVNDDVSGDRGDWMQTYRRMAVAAIDVMRGAADDGAVGRVLALADEWDSLSSKHYAILANRLRAAVGAPATAEGDDGV